MIGCINRRTMITMAKDKKTAKPEKKVEKEVEREFKYGVADLAEKLDLEPASVRVKLRNAGVDKAGKAYGWNTKSELDEVVDQLKAEKPKADKKSKKDEKPAAKDEKKDAKADAAKPAASAAAKK